MLFQLLGELLRPVGMDGCSLESLLRWLPAHRLRLAGCVGFSQQLSTYVSKVAHKCRPCCRHLSAIKTQRPHSIAGAGMRHGLYSGCPQQSLYALSRKGAKNAKATSNCRDLVGRIRAGPKGMFDRLSISVRRPPSRVLPDACLWGDASLSS